MCEFCKTRKRIERARRVIDGIKTGSSVNPEAIANLMEELAEDLASRHNAMLLSSQMAQNLSGIVAEMMGETVEEEEPGATHHNPGSIN